VFSDVPRIGLNGLNGLNDHIPLSFKRGAISIACACGSRNMNARQPDLLAHRNLIPHCETVLNGNMMDELSSFILEQISSIIPFEDAKSFVSCVNRLSSSAHKLLLDVDLSVLWKMLIQKLLSDVMHGMIII
jgi:hypothetical protein